MGEGRGSKRGNGEWGRRGASKQAAAIATHTLRTGQQAQTNLGVHTSLVGEGGRAGDAVVEGHMDASNIGHILLHVLDQTKVVAARVRKAGGACVHRGVYGTGRGAWQGAAKLGQLPGHGQHYRGSHDDTYHLSSALLCVTVISCPPDRVCTCVPAELAAVC